METQKNYKAIKHSLPVWHDIDSLADELASERGTKKQALNDIVAEAIKFFRENRQK